MTTADIFPLIDIMAIDWTPFLDQITWRAGLMAAFLMGFGIYEYHR